MRHFVVFSLLILIAAAPSGFALACEHHHPPAAPARTGEPLATLAADCVGGEADGFPCDSVNLLARMPLADLGGGTAGNDVWGWTDPNTGTEYALMGMRNGTAFVDLSDPTNPVYLGLLPTHTSNNFWHDIKVVNDHAVIVSEAPGHGLQVFHLGMLANVSDPPVTFGEMAHHDGFGSAHNVVVNDETDLVVVVGSNQCSGGLYMLDMTNPHTPVFEGCFSADGYTHDAQCAVYQGPDTTYQGQEICFASNADTLTIVDVTDRSNPVQLSRTTYDDLGYAHQGWLTEDHAYFLLDDELDEINAGHNTQTYIWELSDLTAPQLIATHVSDLPASDHNLYIKGSFAYQANYRAGLRILNLSNIAAGELEEVAYFDTVPGSNAAGTNGSWSVYPFFASGTVLVSNVNEGLFILEPILCTAPEAPTGSSIVAGGDNAFDLSWDAGDLGEGFSVERALGGCGGTFETVAAGLTGTSFRDEPVSGQVTYGYRLRRADPSGECLSDATACVEVSTTGPCTAPPIFAGVTGVTNRATTSCALDVAWDPAVASCGAAVSYRVYRDTDPAFTPDAGNLLAAGLAGTSYGDSAVTSGVEYHYQVRATDSGSTSEDGNHRVASATPTGSDADGDFVNGAEVGEDILASGSATARHIGWEVEDSVARSGDRSYFSTYTNNLCVAMETDAITLTPGEASVLSFWSRYDIEDRYDGGVLQLSSDDGASWGNVTVSPPYPSTFNTSNDACGFSSGTPSFSGTQAAWTEHSADLSAFAGQAIKVRWIFSTDGGLTVDGWYIDDITLTHAQVPSMCSSTDIFGDGFESGTTDLWSASAGNP
ncbi:MAG: choice-of-anchor B family protein [Acidobacteriota bacterium]